MARRKITWARKARRFVSPIRRKAAKPAWNSFSTRKPTVRAWASTTGTRSKVQGSKVQRSKLVADFGLIFRKSTIQNPKWSSGGFQSSRRASIIKRNGSQVRRSRVDTARARVPSRGRRYARAVHQAAARKGQGDRSLAARRAAGVRRRRPRPDEPVRDHGRSGAHGGDPISLRADLRPGSPASAVSLQRRTETALSSSRHSRREKNLLRADRTRCRQRSVGDENPRGARRRSLHH